MSSELTRRPVVRPLLLGLYAQLGAFGGSLMVTAVYATVLAVRARGTPSQALINSFAAWASPWVMAATGVVLTFLFGRQVARETGSRKVVSAVMLGVTSAVISVVPSLVLRGRPGVRTLAFAACIALAGWAGGTLGALGVAKQAPVS
jgi:hypothetical protein